MTKEINNILEYKKELVTLKLSEIIPYEKNNRKHTSKDINRVEKSMQRNGIIAPIIVDENNVIIVGHGRLEAIKKLKKKDTSVIKVYGVPEEKKRSYRIEDNTTGFYAEFDFEAIKFELGELGDFGTDLFDDFNMLGFDLWNSEEEKVFKTEIEDEVPEVEEKVVVKTGDIFQLGEHYLMCGNSTSEKDVEKLLDGKEINMVLTDPPYLMNFVGSIGGDGERRGKKHKKIENDDLKGTAGIEFLEGFLKIIKKYCKGSWYIFFYRLGLHNLFKALDNVKLQYRNIVIWKKEHMNLSPTDYKSIYEPLVNGWADNYTPIFYGWNEDHKFYGKKGEIDFIDGSVSSILENQRTRKNDLHPTMKPISLLEKILNNSTLERHKVLDLFGGSGSTLIACEKKDRICYMIELDPMYIQVIIKRFYNITGGTKEIKCLNRSDIDFSFLNQDYA